MGYQLTNPLFIRNIVGLER